MNAAITNAYPTAVTVIQTVRHGAAMSPSDP